MFGKCAPVIKKLSTTTLQTSKMFGFFPNISTAAIFRRFDVLTVDQCAVCSLSDQLFVRLVKAEPLEDVLQLGKTEHLDHWRWILKGCTAS